MSEHTFINKRRKSRQRHIFNVRAILMLILLSLGVMAGVWLLVDDPANMVCDPDCNDLEGLLSAVFGFFLMLVGVVLAGAIVGVIVALLRRRNAQPSAFESLQQDKDESKED